MYQGSTVIEFICYMKYDDHPIYLSFMISMCSFIRVFMPVAFYKIIKFKYFNVIYSPLFYSKEYFFFFLSEYLRVKGKSV